MSSSDGLAPGTPPEEVRARIRERAEGIPFYAVETVRMLLDRGLLVREDATSTGRRARSTRSRSGDPAGADRRPSGRPHGGGTARVPGRGCARQDVHHEASPRSRSRRGRVEPLLASLVRKEVIAFRSDPLSPERGQYGFLQDLVQVVAYETLSRARAKGAPPRRGAVPEPRGPTRTRSSRSLPRITWTRTALRPRPPTRPRSAPRRERCWCAPANAQRHSGRIRGEAHFEQAAGFADAVLPGGAARAGRDVLQSGRTGSRGDGALRTVGGALRG